MSPSDRRLLDRILRRASYLTPSLRDAIEKAFETLRVEFSEREVERLIASNRIEEVLEAFSETNIRDAFMPVKDALREGVVDAARTFTKDLPRVPVAFDSLSPNVIRGVRQLESRVIKGLTDDLRDTVRGHIEDGLRAGVNPRTTARELRSVLGLAPNQRQAIRNFRRMLETGDREALTRQLRDKRFDPTLDRALGKGGTGLTTEQIDKMAAAYEKRMRAFNAETHARSAALDTQRLAQRMSWEQAIESGVVDRSLLRKKWITAGDNRVREEHEALNGQEVAFDSLFSNGESVPGDSSWNCRCIACYFLARPG